MDKRRPLTSDVVRLGILMGLALVLGVYLIVTTVLICKDGVFYIGLAQVLARDPVGVAHRHSLGYPFLLWVAHGVARLFAGGDSVWLWTYASQSVTLLCRVLALVPLYLLARLLIGSSRALWAILILIVLPYPAWYGSDVLRDWPYVMFLSLGVWILYRALQRRAWWMFALVGLIAAAGYLIQPAAIQLVLFALLGLAVIQLNGRHEAGWRPVSAAVVLFAGFAVPVVPQMCVSGTLVPHQWKPSTSNSPPAIVAVGGKGARSEPLEFQTREGELLEISIEASDPEGGELFFSLVAVPPESRPLYQFRLAGTETRFVTLSESEKNFLIATYSRDILNYEGIVCYAYEQGSARAGLEPVYRFWSPVLQRHFYTIDTSDREAIVAESPKDLWTHEGIVFYAFAEGHQPPDAVPVRRFRRGQAGHCWTLADPGRASEPVPDGNAVDDGIAWYVHVPGELPAGMSLEDSILRWRPAPGRRGDCQINIIVSDGDLESCQLVRIRVAGQAVPGNSRLDPHGLPPYYSCEAPALDLIGGGNAAAHGIIPVPRLRGGHMLEAAAHAYAGIGLAPAHGPGRIARQSAGLQGLPGAADMLFDGTNELLMVFFLVPWCLGLYHRLRHEAEPLERILIGTVLAVNAGLVLARHMWIDTSSDRRYCLTLVVLTIFYVPVGLERIAQWLTRRVHFKGGRWWPADERRWFYVLAVLGIAVCIPKLLTPLSADKRHYLSVVRWLRENTRPDEVTATPDSRFGFYAGRQGLLYRDDVDPRKADYIIRFVDGGTTPSTPVGWSQEYFRAPDSGRGRTVAIYKTHRHER